MEAVDARPPEAPTPAGLVLTERGRSVKRRSMRLRAVRPLLAGILSGALLATGLAAPAAADTPVTVDQDVLANQLFTGIAEARFDTGQDFVKAVTVSAE